METVQNFFLIVLDTQTRYFVEKTITISDYANEGRMLNYFRHGYDFLFAITKVIVVNQRCCHYCSFSFVLNVFKSFFFFFFWGGGGFIFISSFCVVACGNSNQ